MKLLQILVVACTRWLLHAVHTDMPWHAKWPDLPFQFAKLDVRMEKMIWLEKYLGQIRVLPQVPKERVIDEYISLQTMVFCLSILVYNINGYLFDESLE